MIEASAPPSPPVPAESSDPANPSYTFDIVSWVAAPDINESIDGDPKSPDIALFLAKYRSTANPIDWHRYLTLGLYAFIDGNDFDTTWNQQPIDWLTRFRIVWYNYKYHYDNSIEIPIKLHNWATQLAKPFLRTHDIHFLDIDTNSTKWTDVVQDVLEVSDGWTKIKEKDRNKERTKQVTYNLDHLKAPEATTRVRPPTSAASSLASAAKATKLSDISQLTPLSGKLDKPNPPTLDHRQEILNRLAKTGIAKALAAWDPEPKTYETPPLDPPTLATPSTSNPPDHIRQDAAAQKDDMSDAKQSAFKPVLNVPTHDGTQRIIIRWSPKTKGLSPDRRPAEWIKEALEMIQALIGNEHGVFYRWESTDLGTWRNSEDLKAEELREFISPKITYVQAQSMFVFGVRFGFAEKTPIAWKFQESTRQAMKDHNVWCTVSNASCSGGNLTYAGYILMKAPNTTHPIRYLQSLRNKMPENTQFFDIVLLKRTPLEQPIHHLAIQCGENHVFPLTKALSAVLNGNGSAAFLPRVVLSNLTRDQIAKYFLAHSNYVKSLRSICLSPMVTNLDTIREEFFENGDVLKRSTRDWATSLTIARTGEKARCDIVNGGKNHIVNLLAPRHVYNEVLEEVSKYKLRINPLEKREARFLDNLPGLPEVIHIDLSVQQSLDCLERLSSEAIWHQAPPSARNNDTTAAPTSLPTNPAQQARYPPRNSTDSTASHITGITDLSEDTSKRPKPPNHRKSSKQTGSAHIRSQESTASTQSATLTMATYNLEFEKYDKLLESQQAQLDAGFDKANIRWEAFEIQLNAQKAEQNGRFDDLQTKVSKTMKHMANTNERIGKVQTKMDEMMEMLQSLTRKDSRKRSRHLSFANVPTPTSAQPKTPVPPLPLTLTNATTDLQAPLPDEMMIESSDLVLPPDSDNRSSFNAALEQMSIGSSADEATHFSEDEYHDSLGDIDPMIDTESDLELDTSQVPQVTPLITDNASRPLSPPLDTQYTQSRDPAGGAID